jgi:hypothetical protein
MNNLHQKLSELVARWREDGYPCESYPAISEILEWSMESQTMTTRYLRLPQVHALETYWYLRLRMNTPHVFELYSKLFSGQSERLKAMGLDHQNIKDFLIDNGFDALIEKIKTDDDFVKAYHLESLRETLTLFYPSYILALAMGAGKTVLIGSIIATEFAMALEYRDGPFVQNSLVFAPGKTIVESLRELASIPYNKILPPRLYKTYAASVKLTFTRDGEKDIPVIRKSNFNIVVTNTEKIRIQKETIRKADIQGLFNSQTEQEAKEEVANLRLQAIASLPHLAVFSDEAHHTYGQSMESELKKVRKTVDYLAQNTNLIAVINTTGTPYFRRQSLKDVIYWYGLSQGIKDGYLKDPSGNIQAYSFDGNASEYVAHVIKDFFKDYGDVTLPSGATAKLAIYFPQTDDLKELRPVIEKTLIENGRDISICLINTSDTELTKEKDIEDFNRINRIDSPHRVILLVNKGTEGWNCPSLFACALARNLKSSNNFVLQAATRCLRQIHGNPYKARIYLSMDNFNILDRQLQETYGESLSELNRIRNDLVRSRIVLRKLDIPPLAVTKVIRKVIKSKKGIEPITLSKPKSAKGPILQKRIYVMAEQQSTERILHQIGDSIEIDQIPEIVDSYTAAVELSKNYRLDFWHVYDQLKALYGNEEISQAELYALAEQIEKATGRYEIKEETVEQALALVKLDGFEKETQSDGTELYTAEIIYPKDKEHLIAKLSDWKDKSGNFGFHYCPYNFRSKPEQNFFETMLEHLKLEPDDIEDIYFTGSICDPAKTDFYIEYKDQNGQIHNYTPDFIVRKKAGKGRRKGTGKVYIVEIKKEHDRNHVIDGQNGLKAESFKKLERVNPDRIRYEMIFTDSDLVPADNLKNIYQFIQEAAE